MPDKKLVVIGDGSDMKKIKAKATSNIEILGYQPNSVMEEHMRNAKAFIFAAEEDFGITPVEAQACGTPVIAFGKGGSLETVRPLGVDMPTGMFFEQQNISSLISAVNLFTENQDSFEPVNCRDNALKFSVERFKNEMSNYVFQKWDHFQKSKTVTY